MNRGKASRELSAFELVVYVAVVANALRTVVTTGIRLSNELLRRSPDGLLPGLQWGWMGRRPVDLSDAQWRDFRAGLWELTAVLLCFVLGSRIVQRYRARLHRLYVLLFSIVFIGFLHGVYAIHLVGLAGLNYIVCRRCAGKSYGPWVIWIENCGLLLLVRLTNGLPISEIQMLQWATAYEAPVRWHICYNLSMLHFISFGMDLHWSLIIQQTAQSTHAHNRSPMINPNDTVKNRSQEALDYDYYDFVNYLCYVLYPPLYLAGPIATFNNFAVQLETPNRLKGTQLLKTVLRWLCVYLLLEVLTHCMYANSILKFKLWKRLKLDLHTEFSAQEVASASFWMLIFIWLKFLVIWRYFRAWSLFDGIEAPENMVRCLCNNYDSEGFWRHWHASFNLWLVRYLYLPLGGRRKKWLTLWVIFGFVGMWHDIEWKLFHWAWIIAVVYVTEIGVKKSGKILFTADVRQSDWYRYISAACAAVNISLLMTANMVGFGVGLDDAHAFLKEVLNRPSFIFGLCITLYSAVQLMFYLRHLEIQTMSRKLIS